MIKDSDNKLIGRRTVYRVAADVMMISYFWTDDPLLVSLPRGPILDGDERKRLISGLTKDEYAEA